MDCLTCQLRARSIGLLCGACSEAVSTFDTPQAIVAVTMGDTDGALLDQWGRLYALTTSTDIGRTVTSGILISDSSVSRLHARIARAHGVWTVSDLGSSNGTLVNQQFVTSRALAHGDQVSFGRVGFYVAIDLEPVISCSDPPAITCIQSASHPLTRSHTTAQPVPRFARGSLRIIEPTGGGGGFVELAGATAQLSPAQLELVGTLSRRMRDDAHLSWSVRGFVRSSELAASLSWDSPDPDDSHVKQLVRRARRRLIQSGVGDLIEARHGFGYRLRHNLVRS